VGLEFPTYPGEVSDGDEHSYSPHKTKDSLLGTERGTDFTRRLETDVDRNLYVHLAADDTSLPGGTGIPGSVDALAVGAQLGVGSTLLTTIVTYTAAALTKVTRISTSGTVYAKFQLFKNTTLIETKRSGPDRSMDFLFTSPLKLAIGDIIDVKVTHYQTGELADFEATIYGV